MQETVKQMVSPETAQKLQLQIATLEGQNKDLSNQVDGLKKNIAFFEKNLRLLGNAFFAFSNSYRKLQDVFSSAEPALAAPQNQQDAQVPQVPQMPQPARKTEEPDAERLDEPYKPTSALNREHLKVEAFLQAHPGRSFSPYELSLALGISEETAYDAAKILESSIMVSQDGLIWKATKK